jgi:hypothetical protein
MKKAVFVLAAAVLLMFSLLGLNALAGSGDLSTKVVSGGSINYTNNSSSSEFIHMGPADGRSDCSIDYAVYNSDGSVKACGTLSRGIQSVPAGGKAVVTNSGSATVEVYGNINAFTASSSSSPALSKLRLNASASALFTNISTSNAPVSTGSAAFASYNSDHTLYDFSTGSASQHSVPVGGFLVTTNTTGAAITVYGAYEAFTVEASKKTALNRLTLASDETVAFINNSSSDAYVNTDRADYAVYYRSGAIMTYGTGAAGNKLVPAGGNIVVTNSGTAPIDVYGAAEIFSFSPGGNPALLRISLEGGASVTLTNTTSEPSSVYTGRSDYASYASNGSLTAYASSSSGTRNVEAYGKVIVTNNLSAVITVYAPYNVFLAEASSAPALLNTTLSKGKTVRFDNNSTAAVNVYLSRGDYAVYNGGGSFVACSENGSGNIEVPAKGFIIISNSNSSDITAYAPEAIFTRTYQDSDKPALVKTTLQGGETAVYFNFSSDTAPVSSGKVDYVNSLSSGYITAFGSGGSGSFQVSAEGMLKLTNTGTFAVSVYAPSRNFMVWSSTEPALYFNELAPGKSITYYNTTASGQSLIIGKCKYFAYKYNGVLAGSRSSFEGGTVDVPANGRIEIYNTGTSFITVYGPGSAFSYKNDYMCIYDVADPGRDLILPVDLLRSVSGSGSALSAAESALLSFDKTQYKSVTAIERLSLYAEDAAARAATQSIGSGKLSLDAEKLNSAAVSVQAALKLIKERIGKSDIVLNRELRSCVRFVSSSNSLSLTIAADVKEAAADLIIIDAPSYRLYINTEDVSADSSVTASFEAGRLTLETGVMLSLGLEALSGKDFTYQTLAAEDGAVIAAKYNYISRLMEANIGRGGVYSVMENKKEFTDLGSKPKEVRDAIEFLAARGIINGRTDKTYVPDATITRAETAALLVRILGAVYKDEEGSFTDVDESSWFHDAAVLSQKLGLIGGYTDGSFKGNNVITKNELLTVASRLLKSMGWAEGSTASLKKYSDGVADWVQAAAAQSLRAELYPERVDGSFSGGLGLTRGDAAVILYRLYMLMW